MDKTSEQIDRDLLDAICGPFMEFKPSVKKEKLALIADFRLAHRHAAPDDSAVERVAFAIIEGSAGLRAAEHAREFQTANWTDALRSARAAIAALNGEHQ